jgi:polyhydroxybutyrate depolymerase
VHGPASAEFTRPDLPCAPGAGIKPYLGVIGDEDEVMQNAGLWEAARWTVNPVWVQASVRAWHNDEVIGEFQQQRARAMLMCGETLEAGAFTAAGPVDTWRSCAGRLQLKRVRGAGHAASALDEQMGTASTLDLMDTVMAFITGL